MQLEASIGSQKYKLNTVPIDISIPIIFDGAQPNTYGVPIAKANAFEGGGFVGDTRRGGSCNFETYTLTPHCNGTHTECIGHIAKERISIHESLKEALIPAAVISIEPTLAASSSEAYDPELNPDDKLISAEALRHTLKDIDEAFLQALIIRTLPNESNKKSRDYMENLPAFLTHDAMQFIASLPVQHLLLDLPSVDRLFDEGKLSTHHIFWDIEQGSSEVNPNDHSMKTITEMIFVSDEVEDGNYILNLQIASFVADAAPSRPMLFRIEKS